jgi:hypothetical protein
MQVQQVRIIHPFLLDLGAHWSSQVCACQWTTNHWIVNVILICKVDGIRVEHLWWHDPVLVLALQGVMAG